MKKRLQSNEGFTLVEIMIVVAIIALLAAIAIPNLLKAKQTANETAAKGELKTISTSAEMYATANNGTYPANITSLVSDDYISHNYSSAVSGYNFDVSTSVSTAGYTVSAQPVGTAGTKTFSISTGGVLAEL